MLRQRGDDSGCSHGGDVTPNLCFGGSGCADVGLPVSRLLVTHLVSWLRYANSNPTSGPYL